MAATYDPTLPSDADHVRFLVGDTDITAALFQDEEIAAVLAEETATGDALKWFAAASLLSILSARWASAGRGVFEKQVGRLRIQYGGQGSGDALAVLAARISEMRRRGAFLLNPRPKVFRVL